MTSTAARLLAGSHRRMFEAAARLDGPSWDEAEEDLRKTLEYLMERRQPAIGQVHEQEPYVVTAESKQDA